MKFTMRHAFVICVLIGLSFGAGAWVSAQGRILQSPAAATVYSGADIGFRVTDRKGDTPIGELVVRVNGEWKPVQFAMGPRPLTK